MRQWVNKTIGQFDNLKMREIENETI